MARMKLIKLVALLLGLASPAFAGCPPVNPNASGPPYVDGCDLPAAGLNLLAGGKVTLPYLITDHKTVAQNVSANTFTATSDGTTVASLVGANQQDLIIAGVEHVINGSTLINLGAVAGYVLNDNGVGSGLSGNGVALYGWARSNVTNAWTWGLNTLTISKSGIGANHQISIEADVNAVNTTDNVTGIQISGGSTATPSNSEAVVVTPVGSGIPWQAAIFTQPGAATDAYVFGANAASGTNVPSQTGVFQVLDGSGLTQTWLQQATSTSMNFSSSVANPAFQFNGNMALTVGRTYNLVGNVMLGLTSGTVSFVPDTGVTALIIGNATTTTSIKNLVTATGAGAATKYVCVDAGGNTVVQSGAC